MGKKRPFHECDGVLHRTLGEPKYGRQAWVCIESPGLPNARVEIGISSVEFPSEGNSISLDEDRLLAFLETIAWVHRAMTGEEV